MPRELPRHRRACAGCAGQLGSPRVRARRRFGRRAGTFARDAEPERAVILRGGPILTMDDAHPVGEALAIRGSTILGVGSLTEVKRHYTPGTEIIDLAGHAVLPGFVEPHVHVLESALAAAGIDRADAAAGLLRAEPRARRGARRPRAARARDARLHHRVRPRDRPARGRGRASAAGRARPRARRSGAPARGVHTRARHRARRDAPAAGDEHYDVVGIAYWADGSIEDFVAALGEPYLNGRGSGALAHEEAELREAMRVWHDAGWQLVVHARGRPRDRAGAALLRGDPRGGALGPAPPHRALHARHATSRSRRAAALGLVGQPHDRPRLLWGKAFRDQVLGPERAAHIHSLRREPRAGPRELLPQRLPRSTRSIPAWRCAPPPPA